MLKYKCYKIILLLIVLSFFLSSSLFGSWKYYYSDNGVKKHKKIALIVGVNSFDDPYWPTLKYAAKDAEDFALILKKEGRFDRIIILNRPDNTGKNDIQSKIDEIMQENISEDDTLIIYFSTHGTILDEKDGFNQYLVVKDTTEQNLKKSSISISYLKNKFNLFKSTRKLLMIASCYGGVGKSKLNTTVQKRLIGMKGPLYTPFERASQASIILSASRMDEPAREDDTLQNDIYTHFFIKAILDNKLTDRNNDGTVSALEAHDVAKELTYHYTAGKQIPTAYVSLAGADPVILSGKPKRVPNPTIFGYSGNLSRYKLYANGREKGTFPGATSLSAGTYEIEIRNDNNELVYKEKLRLKEGNRISISDLLLPKKNEVGVTAGGAFFPLNKWEEKVGAGYGLTGGIYYNYYLLDIGTIPLKIRGESDFLETPQNSVNGIFSSKFKKFDFKISPRLYFAKIGRFSSELFLGAGLSLNSLDFFVQDSEKYKTSDDDISIIYFGGLGVEYKIVKDLFFTLSFDTDYSNLSYSSFGKLDYLALSAFGSFEMRF